MLVSPPSGWSLGVYGYVYSYLCTLADTNNTTVVYKQVEADNKENLLFTHNGIRHCGYKKEILPENIDKLTENMITCRRCEGIIRDPCGVGIPVVVTCKPCCYGETPIPLDMFGNVLEMNVRCPLSQRPNMCDWEGHLRNVEQHLDECDMFIIDCALLCGRTLPRNEHQAHTENDCVMREVQCEHCRERFLFKDIATHHGICGRYPINCINNECEQVVPRDELDDHFMECDFTQIFCDYAKYGCDRMLQIKDRVRHNEECELSHLRQKMNFMEKQIVEMKGKINQNDALAGYHLCLKGQLNIGNTETTISSRTFTVPPSRIVFKTISSILNGVVNISIQFRSSSNIAFDFWTVLDDQKDRNLSSFNTRQIIRVDDITFTAIPARSYEFTIARLDLAEMRNAMIIIFNNVLKLHIFALQI